MRRVNIVKVEDSAAADFTELLGARAGSGVSSRGVVTGPDRPLWLWAHDMSPGSEFTVSTPDVGHVFYVWKGSVNSGDETLGAECVIGVEHKGSATLRAGTAGATLLHYHSRAPGAQEVRKPGGHVHRVPKNGRHKVKQTAYYEMVNTIWLDSECPNCDLWFHQSRFFSAYPQSNPHFHSEDEIIFVVDGGMVLGSKVHKPGTAIAVDADTTYGFGVDEGGLAFTNFRPCEPHFVMMSRDGPMHEPISELAHMKKQTPIT